MSRPVLLDLYCGAGGAAMGYHRAGFDVVGVDVKPQPRYPFTFVQADALEYLAAHGDEFDVKHASPPCLDHTPLAAVTGGNGTGWLLDATREAFRAIGGAYVIENVPGAPMDHALRLCGSEFGLQAMDHDGVMVALRRHRYFESNVTLMGAGGCQHDKSKPVAGCYGGNSSNRTDLAIRNAGRRGGYVPRTDVRAALLGIDWMTRNELNLAIPPAYTEHLGTQLRAYVAVAA